MDKIVGCKWFHVPIFFNILSFPFHLQSLTSSIQRSLKRKGVQNLYSGGANTLSNKSCHKS